MIFENMTINAPGMAGKVLVETCNSYGVEFIGADRFCIGAPEGYDGDEQEARKSRVSIRWLNCTHSLTKGHT